LAALIWLPRTYESEAKIFVRLGRESVALDPTATTGSTMPVIESRESQINSTRDLLSSRNLYESVVNKLGPETILNDSMEKSSGTSLLSKLKSTLPDLSFGPEVTPREKAVNKLAKSVNVTVGRGSSVLTVSSRAKDPKLAQAIMEAFIEGYQQQHWAANRTAGSFEFFSEQTMQLKQQLDYAHSRLRDAKNETALVSIPVEQQALQTQLTQCESARMDTEAALAASEAMIASLSKALKLLPEQVVMQSTNGHPNQAADAMRQEFFKLQISNRELESRLGANHPLVKTALAQTAELEKIVKAEAADRTQTTLGLNASKQTLELELAREEAKVASYRGKIATLDEQFAQLRERVRKLNEHEVLIADLERELALATAKYQSYADHLEQARIGEALENYRISNVNVVQQPSFCERPVNPKPLVILGLGALFAICGSVCLVIGIPTEPLAGNATVDVPVPGNGALQIRHPRAEHANRGVPGGRFAASIDTPQ
jgi:uncharacterized protein involved in exopolysaccharide biosynthesis